MHRMKKLLALCLTLVMLLGVAPGAMAAEGDTYSDVPTSHWAHDIIEKWTGYGVLVGCGDGTFAPDRTMTVGELAVVLSRLFGYSERTGAVVTPKWADPYVEKVIAAGILDSAVEVDATVMVTREQAAKYMAIAFGIAPVEGDTSFLDDANIDPAYKPYVNTLQQAGFVEGGGGRNFVPKDGLTRAHVIQMLDNIVAVKGMPSGTLRAGAGNGEIIIDGTFYPVEGFGGEVHLNPYVRVLLLEQETRIAIVSFEMVAIGENYIEPYKEIVSGITGTPVDNVWIHATHAITTPHSPGDAGKAALLDEAMTKAQTEASTEAAGSFQNAVMGVGTGYCDVNANGNILIDGQYYVGEGSDLPSNKEMTILRFDSLAGDPIGFMVSYGIKPTAIDNSEMKEETRQISSDVPGVACRMMEAEFGVPAMFVMPAAGDQIPKQIGVHWVAGEDGKPVEVSESVERGIEVVERLGGEMGEAAIDIAYDVTYTNEKQAISIDETTFTWPTKNKDGEMTVAVRGITIGDEVAFVGFSPEVNALTERQLWEASPYEHTLLMSFINGDQKYMPDATMAEPESWQWKRSGFSVGAAEHFVEVAANLLTGMTDARVSALRAGAGNGEIVIDGAFYPVEGFNGSVHLNPYVRVLVLEQDTQVAIVSFEMVAVGENYIAPYKQIVSEITGTPVENIWIHATHAITTPHSPGDADKAALLDRAMAKALTEAAEEAAASFQPAAMGVGTGYCDVNANGNIYVGGGYYVGEGSTLTSNKEMTILRFDSLAGDPIGFLISYGIKPTAIDNSEMAESTRSISSDVPGVACLMMEEEYGVPAMFVMPAAGDQIPKQIGVRYEEDENGNAVEIRESVARGIEVVERLGGEMGETAISIADGIVCTDEAQAINIADTSFTWASMSGDGEMTVAVRGITIGDDVAFVGFSPEVNANTERQLWEASSYEHTLLMSFINGDQKYMPDDEAYDMQTWQWKRSGFARGAAEHFVDVAAAMLANIESMSTTGSGGGSGSVAGEKKTIEMGGYEWIVLEEQEDRMLVLSNLVLEQRAYHSAGGAITWENSEIRAYLNGEFIGKTFSAEEQARIIETTLENRSNSVYGIAGGNATDDKVFLLSQSEFERYFTGSVELARGTLIDSGSYVWWHLRSPGEATDVNAGVTTIGLMDNHGLADGVSDPTAGVRPAMWVTLGD